MQFGVDRSWKGNIRELERVSNAPAATKTTEEKEEAQGIHRFDNIKYTVPQSSGTNKIGNTTYLDYYSYGGKIRRSVTIPASAVFLGEDGEEPVNSPKEVPAYIVGYDGIKNVLIVTIAPDYEVGTWQKSANVAIPVGDLPAEFRDPINGLKIKTADGVIPIGTGTTAGKETIPDF